MTYVFSMWACYVLYMEYKTVATMRLRHLASETRRPDQLTVSYSIFFLLTPICSLKYIGINAFAGTCEKCSSRP